MHCVNEVCKITKNTKNVIEILICVYQPIMLIIYLTRKCYNSNTSEKNVNSSLEKLDHNHKN